MIWVMLSVDGVSGGLALASANQKQHCRHYGSGRAHGLVLSRNPLADIVGDRVNQAKRKGAPHPGAPLLLQPF